MKKVILKIEGMSCSACSSSLEKYLKKQEHVYDASVNLVLSLATITYKNPYTVEDLIRFVRECGYDSPGVYDEKVESMQEQKKTKNLIIYGVLALFVFYISMAHMLGLPEIPLFSMQKHPYNYGVILLLFAMLYLYYGRDILKKGLKSFMHKSPNMDTLVTIGANSCFLYSLYNLIKMFLGEPTMVEHLYFESCVMIIFFVKLGRVIDSNSKEKTKDAIKSLVQITPEKALLKKGKEGIETTIDEVKKGDILIAKPGMKIAVDGTVTKGESYLNEAFITGESALVKKTVGNKVIAGSMNVDGYIEYKAEKIGRDSTISEIVRLVIESVNTKAPIARIADKVSGIFVPTIMVLSIVTLIGYLLLGYSVSEAMISFVTVLVVACPCALGLATPLAIVVANGLCAKHGILVKNSTVLEVASTVNTVVFDKTGTLTYGNLQISKVYHAKDITEKSLLTKVGMFEKKSTHPIAQAFKHYFNEEEEITDFKNIPGVGMTGKIKSKEIFIGSDKLFSLLSIENPFQKEEKKLLQSQNSLVYIIEDKKAIGLIGIRDVVRKEAKSVVSYLRRHHIDVYMLSGDNEVTSHLIAKECNIDTVIAKVSPQEKTTTIKNLMKDKTVMMVGDGINDAPSLATAHVGVSIAGASDIATDSAEVILMNENLEKIPEFIKLSKRTIKNIKQNLFWAFFYNIVMIPIAIGLLKPWGITMNPMFASLAMTLSSLTVIINALRLKKERKIEFEKNNKN